MIGARMNTAWTGVPPERIAAHGHVEQRQHRLVAVRDLLGQDDHPGAGAEDRRTGRRKVQEWGAQLPAVDELAHRRRLPARQAQPAQAGQVGRQAHLDRLHADDVEHADVLREITLECEDPDSHHRPRARPRLTSP
jgi:hypothetical protein